MGCIKNQDFQGKNLSVSICIKIEHSTSYMYDSIVIPVIYYVSTRIKLLYDSILNYYIIYINNTIYTIYYTHQIFLFEHLDLMNQY